MSAPPTRERRPGRDGASEDQAGRLAFILAAAVDDRTDDAPPTLAAMTPRARSIALAYFEAGRAEGIAAGRRQVEDELGAEWDALTAEVLPRLRAAIPFADLADRRGQHHRAERQVALLRANGVTP